MSRILKFYLNGNLVHVAAGEADTLLDVLRDGLGLTSPKCGCNHGDCGACTVILNGYSAKSCTILALTAEGKNVWTVDGLANGDKLHPVQRAFHEYGAPQCGYCTPGMVMAAVAFLNHYPSPTESEVKEALSGNLCRCGGYKKYVQAVMAAARGEFGPLPEGSVENV
ncbi:MAG: (2Fe-2S)-binding protein [Synergistaceae bacterium]|jgi:aerobic-type carbon monoxide dehydrogenase small subunit (CoxS/CutS family)|nr:(2Fe-2S)-binding protein [Synergistaceae bacterium]